MPLGFFLNILEHFCDIKLENAIWKQLISDGNGAWSEIIIDFQHFCQLELLYINR